MAKFISNKIVNWLILDIALPIGVFYTSIWVVRLFFIQSTDVPFVFYSSGDLVIIASTICITSTCCHKKNIPKDSWLDSLRTLLLVLGIIFALGYGLQKGYSALPNGAIESVNYNMQTVDKSVSMLKMPGKNATSISQSDEELKEVIRGKIKSNQDVIVNINIWTLVIAISLALAHRCLLLTKGLF